MATCKFFLKGNCKYGDKCRSSHDVSPTVETASHEAGPFATKDPGPPGRALPIHTKNFTAGHAGNDTQQPSKTSLRPCKFFPLGTCMWGPSCRNSHDLADFPKAPKEAERQPHVFNSAPLITKRLNPNIGAFVPSSVRVAEILSGLELDVRPVCHFYAKGTCKNGILCRFYHDGDDGVENKIPNDGQSTRVFTRQFHGANVTFTAGAEVSKVKLLSDHSTLQLNDLPSGAKTSSVKEILSVFGFDVPTSSIRVKPMRPTGSLAKIEFDDPDSAKRIAAIITESLDDDGDGAGELGAKVIQSAAKFGNRLQLTSVTCSWYRPSLSATLIYYDMESALLAQSTLRGENRGPPFVSDPRFKQLTGFYYVKVRGLRLGTTEEDLNSKLPILAKPGITLMEEPSYAISDDDAGEIVETLLRRLGPLDFYECKVNTELNSIRAKASFRDKDTAVRAEADMNKMVVPEFGDSRLNVARVISIKYNVSQDVMSALRPHIHLVQESNAFPDVKFSTYEAAPPTTPFATIRIFGKEEKAVSQAKAMVEKSIAGTVVTDGEAVLWHPWFRSSEGVLFVKDLCGVHNLYIHIDTGKSNLVFYGGSGNTRQIVREGLVAKVKDLSKDTHQIVLDKGLLSKTLRGGMQKVREKFGKAATFNLSNTPRTITIRGSEADFLLAQGILKEATNDIISSSEDDCSICWCPAEDPLVTSCGHTYCKTCFYAAVSSSTKEIPFSCHGSQGKCGHPFVVRELQTLLPFARLETLLQDSFERYISMKPEELQYCPMPDCQSLYHPSKFGVIVTCNSCLNDICTSCNIVSHHPISCEDWKENYADGGTRAFERWKNLNDAKDCPKCKTALMKSEGCNHMQCDGCKTHICWKCLKTFDIGEACYTHMTINHGGFYDGDIYQDTDTDTDDE